MKLLSSHIVPHTGPDDADIFFIGDCPGTTEDTCSLPIAGRARDYLENALQQHGIDIASVRIGNLLNYAPAKNDIKKAHGTWQLDEGRTQLLEYLSSPRHKVLVPLDNEVLMLLTGQKGIEKHRGSVYNYKGMSVIPTLHPSLLLWDGSSVPAFLHDIQKIVRHFSAPVTEPKFNFIVNPNVYELEGLLPLLRRQTAFSVDIETKKDTSYIRCIGFAWSAVDAVCIYNDAPYVPGGGAVIGSNFRRIVGELLSGPAEKTFHNGMFDTMMLEENGFSVENWTYDTMVAQHVLQPELPIGLDYCTSMYTDINYYKDDGKESGDRIDRVKLGIYNCKDVCATWQVKEGQLKEFAEEPGKYEYFKYKMKQIPLAKHFSQTGLLVDMDRRDELHAVVTSRRDADYQVFIGIQQLLGVKEYFKVSQSSKIKEFLYDTLQLKVKTNKDGKATADEDAIVEHLATVERKLQELKTDSAKQQWQIKLAALKLILRIRGYDKLLGSYINIDLSPDGRARSWYKFWGTETGRWSASNWYDRTGLNGQTIPRESI